MRDLTKKVKIKYLHRAGFAITVFKFCHILIKINYTQLAL